MIKKLSLFANKYGTFKALIILTIVWIIMQVAMMVKPFGLAQIDSISPGTKIVELKFNYSNQVAHETLDKLGTSGRKAYVNLIVLDFLYIVIYAIFFMVCMAAILRHFHLNNRMLLFLLVLPLMGGLLDISENIVNLIQITEFPNESPVLFTISNMITMTKMIVVVFCEIIIGIGFLGYLISMTRNKLIKNKSN